MTKCPLDQPIRGAERPEPSQGVMGSQGLPPCALGSRSNPKSSLAFLASWGMMQDAVG